MTTPSTPPAASTGNKTAEVVARLQAALDKGPNSAWLTNWRDDNNWRANSEFAQECEPAAIQTLLTALREQEETIASLRAAAGSNQ